MSGKHRGRRLALLSVTDKTGVVDFARGLLQRDFGLVSTGGTAAALRQAGLPVQDISERTGFPELLDGRLKTLHPVVHGGLLALRDDPAHCQALEAHGIAPIDVVAVNLYAFRETVARPGTTEAQAIENIDIGGPGMLRSAAKNHRSVWVVCDPAEYGAVLAGLDLEAHDPGAALERRRRLAAAAFRATAGYDAAIAAWWSTRFGEDFPERLVLETGPARPLRYGENPAQAAAFYPLPGGGEAAVARARQLAGKELSYNNLLDADAALELVKEFDRPVVAVIKHTNPCGCAVADDPVDAFRAAWDGDSQSAFGGIVACNRTLDLRLAQEIARPERFIEVIVAPVIEPAAAELIVSATKWGRNVRLLETGPLPRAGGAPVGGEPALRSIVGGLLVQRRDGDCDGEPRRQASRRAPSPAEAADLEFAWRVCKHVKSNAIVLARDGAVVGVGAGQMSRVDSVEIAGRKAGQRARGAVLASDAFFPFRDSIDAAAALGVTAVIQPGGSVRDAESVAAADEHGLALVLTDTRHFRH